MPWTRVKRRAQIEPTAESEEDLLAASMADELAELRMWRDELLRPMSVSGAFNLLDSSHRIELARQLWSGDYLSSLCGLREGNQVLVEVLHAQVSNTYDRRASEGHLLHKQYTSSASSTVC